MQRAFDETQHTMVNLRQELHYESAAYWEFHQQWNDKEIADTTYYRQEVSNMMNLEDESKRALSSERAAQIQTNSRVCCSSESRPKG